MKLRMVLRCFSTLVILAGLAVTFRVGGHALASPFLVVGPQAVPASVPGPNYGLFTCQVGLSSAVCYDPYQMRHAYHIDSLIAAGYTGAGHTIVIIDAFQSPYLPVDLAFFDSFYGLPAPQFSQVAPDGLTPFNPSDPNMVGWSEEITLDVEWAHAIAPDAAIVLVLAKSNSDADILSATQYAVDNNLGDIISQSFGENESCVDPGLLALEHQVFAEATQKHITLFASSGDDGAAQPTCDGSSWVRAASSPASDPLVTAVGGTELHAAGYCLTVLGCNPSLNPAPGTYQGEITWNEFDAISTGGGFSVLYDEPSYQQGTIHGGKQRGVPDVSYNAAVYHGVLVRYAGHWYLFGGTSAGSPQWSGIMAIANQAAGQSLGFINTALYHIGQAPPHYAASLNDVTSGNNSVVELDANNNPVAVQGFNAGPGWDAATGLGSPIADGAAGYLIQFVSPGDAVAAIAGSNPHAHGKPSAPGHVRPH